MAGLVFAAFAHRSHAESARRALARSSDAGDAAVRLHESGLDPLAAVDLGDSDAQRAREREAIVRFVAPFVFLALAGAIIDLFAAEPGNVIATTLLGGLGLIAGTLLVLTAPHGPLDRALAAVDEAFARGEILLTVPVADDAQRTSIERAMRDHGGRTIAGG